MVKGDKSELPKHDITNEPMKQTTFEIDKDNVKADFRIDRDEEGNILRVGEDEIGGMDSAREIQLTLCGSAHFDEILEEDVKINLPKQTTFEE
ncbi:MAG: hypothetical protein JXA43_01245 [Candidatus Diapherotrites archaeon]|nr:hypothetical protein [Candidatus Diapherotrites archaeon]